MNSTIVRKFALSILFGFLLSNVAIASLKGHKRTPSIEDSAELQKRHREESGEIRVTLLKAPSPLEKIHRQLIDTFGGHEADGVFFLDFQDQKIPLRTLLLGQKLELFVEGKSGVLGHPCFELSVDLSLRTGWVNRVYSALGNCPFSGNRHGTLLLDFVDQLSWVFKLSEVRLFDQSEIQHEKTGVITGLRFLMTMLKGKGWYESHGYLPLSYQTYREAVEKFRNFPISQLKQNLRRLKSRDWFELRENYFDKHWFEMTVNYGAQAEAIVQMHNDYFRKIGPRLELINQQLELFAATVPERAALNQLHVFFSWLWETDRVSCAEVQEFLFPREDGVGIDLELGTFSLFPDETVFIKKYNWRAH